jgi:hypothetical protein
MSPTDLSSSTQPGGLIVIALRRSLSRTLLVSLALIAAGCGGGAAPSPSIAPAPTSAGPRPSSPAMLQIVEPVSGATVTGTTVHVVLKLTGARIVTTTSTAINPDEGHVHLYVDNNLVSMNYGLDQELEVHPGTYVLRAEFVASDHAPFNPRVWSDQVFFTVK